MRFGQRAAAHQRSMVMSMVLTLLDRPPDVVAKHGQGTTHRSEPWSAHADAQHASCPIQPQSLFNRYRGAPSTRWSNAEFPVMAVAPRAANEFGSAASRVATGNPAAAESPELGASRNGRPNRMPPSAALSPTSQVGRKLSVEAAVRPLDD